MNIRKATVNYSYCNTDVLSRKLTFLVMCTAKNKRKKGVNNNNNCLMDLMSKNVSLKKMSLGMSRLILWCQNIQKTPVNSYQKIAILRQ